MAQTEVNMAKDEDLAVDLEMALKGGEHTRTGS
jgi:hypothetical protein